MFHLFGRRRPDEFTEPPPPATLPVSSPEGYASYVLACRSRAQPKLKRLFENYNLEECTSIQLDHDVGTAWFRRSDGSNIVKFSYIPVGMLAAPIGMWLWSWADPDNLLAEKSAKLKELAALTGQEFYALPNFPISDEQLYDILAISADYLDAIAPYIAPLNDGNMKLFLALTERID